VKSLKICGALLLSFSLLISSVVIPSNEVFASTATTHRLQGEDRYKTAIAISTAGWTTSENVVLATGQNFPDALSATPLAKQLNAPILLVGKTFDSALEAKRRTFLLISRQPLIGSSLI